jgi:capsular exopolysaccharide synthesis family protein
VVTVSFDSYSPALAADVANTVAGEYIAWSMESRLQGLGTTREFLSRRVEEARNELRASEEAYTRYLTDRRIISLDDRGNIALARTEELNRQLVDAENDRRSAEALYQRSRQVAADELTPVLADPTIQALTRELSRQRQEMANLSARYQPGYTAVRQVEEQVKQLELQLTEAKQRIVRNVETQFRVARAREDDLRGALLRSKGETIQQNRESTELNLIKQKTETDRKNYEDLLQRLRQAEVESDFRPANMRIVQRAEVPITPVRPNRVLNIGLGLLIGLALGIGMAFFIEYLNNTVNTAEEVERILQLPSLGAIPSLETLTRRRSLRGRTAPRVPLESGLGTTVTRAELVSTHESVSSFAESYRALRTSLLLSSAERAPRIMLVTSSYPAEGKTTIASNTAISLAQTGARVLVLDADMRRPRCHRILRVPNEVGLSTYLSREVELERAIQPHEIPTLSIMPAGPIPPNPSELLSSPKLRGLLAEAQDQFDHIIIDSPPVIQVSDALIISPLVDGVVLVVKSGQTPREVVLRAKQALFDVNAKIFGVVLNGINLRADGYYYNYKYSYDQSYPEN